MWRSVRRQFSCGVRSYDDNTRACTLDVDRRSFASARLAPKSARRLEQVTGTRRIAFSKSQSCAATIDNGDKRIPDNGGSPNQLLPP